MALPERFIKKFNNIRSVFVRVRNKRKKRFLGQKKLYKVMQRAKLNKVIHPKKIVHPKKVIHPKQTKQSYLLKHKPFRFIKNDKM